MFDNIGNKIKGLSYLLLIVGILVSIITGSSWISQGNEVYGSSGLILSGWTIIFAGSFGSVIVSFLLYGFGELITDVKKLVQNDRQSSGSATSPSTNSNEPSNEGAWTCDICHRVNPYNRKTCAGCRVGKRP